MNLYLVRHPQPHDVRGRCYGRRDVAIGPQALSHALGAVRRQLNPALLAGARIFCSPATRCVLLARELAAPRAPIMDEALLEMDFGAWEGLDWDAVPRHEMDAWAHDVWGYAPGGAESAAAVARRWRRWSTSVGASGATDAVVVTHAGVIRVALHECGTLSTLEFSRAVIGFGSVHRIEIKITPSAVYR